ncbi:MAG: DUF2252 domain-containing protein [Pirellulaceae bacterium]|nr:DUF2252 domain-containing protein [Pirellulaceae bacterium]
MAKKPTLVTPHLAHFRAPPRDRYDEGRARREAVPLECHAEAANGSSRKDPLQILQQQNLDQGRVEELIPLRFGRMSLSPFTYLRGAAAVQASDLASGPRTDLWVELCGDAHLGNFRWFLSPERKLVFDLNDFDETLPGPFEWDVKRLAASVMVAARINGFPKKKCHAATRAALQHYREAMITASELSPLDLFYYRFRADEALKKVARQGAKHRRWKENILAKAARKNSMRALNDLTEVVDGHRMIIADPPRTLRIDEELATRQLEEITQFFESYKQSLPLDRRVLLDQFWLVDVARKVVGVGSVGTRCLIVLLESNDGTPLFLQFKQATKSVLEQYLGPSAFEQSGQRVVEGQRLIQATSDMFLGWSRWQANDGQPVDFYFRQLWDGKGKICVEELSPSRLAIFAGLCGKTLAYAHARSGDPMMIRGYIGEDEGFDDLLIEYADRYADRTWADHTQLDEAIRDGSIEAIRDL